MMQLWAKATFLIIIVSRKRITSHFLVRYQRAMDLFKRKQCSHVGDFKYVHGIMHCESDKSGVSVSFIPTKGLKMGV